MKVVGGVVSWAPGQQIKKNIYIYTRARTHSVSNRDDRREYSRTVCVCVMWGREGSKRTARNHGNPSPRRMSKTFEPIAFAIAIDP